MYQKIAPEHFLSLQVMEALPGSLGLPGIHYSLLTSASALEMAMAKVCITGVAAAAVYFNVFATEIQT